MIPPNGVKYKLKKVVDGTPPKEVLEIIGREVTGEEWDDMEKEQEENNLDEMDESGSGNMNVVDDVEEHGNVDETEDAGDQADATASTSI